MKKPIKPCLVNSRRGSSSAISLSELRPKKSVFIDDTNAYLSEFKKRPKINNNNSEKKKIQISREKYEEYKKKYAKYKM